MWPDSQCSALWARSRSTICRPRRPARSRATLASGSMVLAGSFAGTGLRGGGGGGRRGAGAGHLILQGRDAGVLGGGGEARVGEQGGEAALGGGQGLVRVATAALAWSRAGLRVSLVFVSMLAR